MFLFLSFRMDMEPPAKASKVPLLEATFLPHELANFTKDIEDACAETALAIFEQLNLFVQSRVEVERDAILTTFARCVTKNQALFALHLKFKRTPVLPDNHRLLHTPGSHLLSALEE